MFSHKKVKAIKRGDPVPSGAKYLKSESKVVRQWEEEVSPQHAPETCYEYGWFDVYEIPCNEDGSTELKVSYASSPAEIRRNTEDKCDDCWQTGGYHTEDCRYNPF